MTDKSNIWALDEFFWDELFRELLESIVSRKRTEVGGLSGSAISFACATAHRITGLTLVIAPSVKTAENLRDDLSSILGDVYYFPAYETLPWDGELAHQSVISDRIECLQALRNASPGTVIIVPAAALVKKLPSPESFRTMELSIGLELSMEMLEGWLISAGYERESGVYEQGRWAKRGGIIDIGCLGRSNPIRLEFDGNEIHSIRIFDQRSQRSIKQLDTCMLLPAREVFLTPEHWNSAIDRVPEDHILHEKLCVSTGFPGIEHYIPVFYENLSSLFDYAPSGTLAIISDPHSVDVHIRDAIEFHRSNYSRTSVPFEFDDLFGTFTEITEQMENTYRILILNPFPKGDVDVFYNTVPIRGFAGQREEMFRQFAEWKTQNRRIAVLCDSEAELDSFAGLLPEESRIDLGLMQIGDGFSIPEKGIVVLPERTLLSHRRRPVRKRKFKGGEGLKDIDDLVPDDLIVHKLYGIGRFKGIERVETSGMLIDCLVVEYRDQDRLLVPMDEIDSIQKYLAPGLKSLKLDKIGGIAWQSRVSRAKGKARQIAGKLAMLYAERRASTRNPYSPPGNMFASLRRSFPYEETEDQRKAIDSVIADLQATRPMDRLIAGDVGYGKTEVAIRGAVRVVEAGFQAVIVVPTTILAEQHYNTFSDRLAEFPIRVEMLSRFRTPTEQKIIMGELAIGEVDIIIGTHRLLQKDIRFHKPGILIIDEEHRFGVRQKESLREMKTSIDTLSMTATPIPRTLHMALSGFRDISIIASAPRDRYPVHTEVAVFNRHIVRKGILRELERDGQVFYVHNRIRSIEKAFTRLSETVPEARIVIAHGRMNPKTLENIMHSFIEGRYDILLSTSIIESGLDLPGVNTIFIENANMFGLAELYQLRGRVGRSHHQAYCYLLTELPLNKLKPDSRGRLNAIRKFTELGSGWHIAMRDLEIRGAGELLGASQHGQMISIGYSLFAELIEHEVKQLIGIVDEPVRREVRVELEGDAYIPVDYIPDLIERIRIYRQIWMAENEEGIADLLLQMQDRFGEPPEPVINCARRAGLRLKALSSSAEEVVLTRKTARIVFPSGTVLSGEVDKSVDVKIEKTGRIVLTLPMSGLTVEEGVRRTKEVLSFSIVE